MRICCSRCIEETILTEIQFHLYANGYKSKRTLFGKAYPINSETQTQIDIKSFLVNGKNSNLVYFQPDIQNPYDSTVAKVLLDKAIQPKDSVKIHFEYTMQIPRSVKRLGYATGRNFFFVSAIQAHSPPYCFFSAIKAIYC